MDALHPENVPPQFSAKRASLRALNPDVSTIASTSHTQSSTFTSMNLHHRPETTASGARRKPRRVLTQIYGFVLTEEWIKDFAARKNLGTPNNLLDTASSVVMDILRKTRLRRPYVVKWKDGSALCIGIAHNKTPEGLKLITPERIDMVKRAMEVDEGPSWHYAE